MRVFCLLFVVCSVIINHVAASLLTQGAGLTHKQQQLEDICGKPTADALLEYARFHEDVVQGRTPRRSLVAVAVEAGLADRLTGVISLFWLSFFSKHAFFIGTHEMLPKFESAYEYVFVNWTKPLWPSTVSILFVVAFNIFENFSLNVSSICAFSF